MGECHVTSLENDTLVICDISIEKIARCMAPLGREMSTMCNVKTSNRQCHGNQLGGIACMEYKWRNPM